MRPTELVGREAELARLRAAVATVVAGRGGVVWVEGEPGIGKSALLAAGLGGAAEAGCRVVWGVGDELGRRVPLWVLTRAFGVRHGATDAGLADIARLLHGAPPPAGVRPAAADLAAAAGEDGATGVVAALADDATGAAPAMPIHPVGAAAARLLAWVEVLAVPLVVVVDDAQWADEASLLVMGELGRLAGQLQLLLVVAGRPVPRRPEVAAARRALLSAGAPVMSLRPLTQTEVAELVGRLVGARPGPGLLAAATQAGGNPLYVREVMDTLLREQRTRVRAGAADVADPDRPVSLAGAISDRLAFLSQDAVGVLRCAALLGGDFSVAELAAVCDRAAAGLVGVVEEAVAAGVLLGSGPRLAFRHGLIRQALVESMPAAVRAALHAEAARALHAAGAPREQVAEQLHGSSGAGGLVAGWVLDWLAVEGGWLVQRAPRVGVELLQAALPAADNDRGEVLANHLLIGLWLEGRAADLEPLARRILEHDADPERVGRAAWTLAYVISRAGRDEEALAVSRRALTDPRVTGRWAARLRARHALSLYLDGQHAEAEAVGQAALVAGERAADRFATGYALHVLSCLASWRRDRGGTVAHIERALEVLGTELETADLRLMLMANRAANLEALGRLDEATRAGSEAVRQAEQVGSVRLAAVRTTVAELRFAIGQWDDALVDLGDIEAPDPNLWYTGHGIRALIAIHRDDRKTADAALETVAGRPPTKSYERDGYGQVLAAYALAAERDGHPEQAVRHLAVVLEPEWASDMEYRHVLLPAVVRAAMAVRDRATATEAAAGSAAEAEWTGNSPTTLAEAAHCRGLLTGDAGLLASVAERYHELGRPLEAAQAAEDAAAAYAERADLDAAREMLDGALARYAALGASWDVSRAQARLRGFGVRGRVPRARRRPDRGWDSLTETEVKVAVMVAQGMSNPQIADQLYLSRRTVQTHVSHILAKLDVPSRLDIARSVPAQTSPAGRR